MSVDLKDRTALVTGSTSRIGKATALALAARGAHVLVVGRDVERAERVVAEIEGGGGTASFRLTALGDVESAARRPASSTASLLLSMGPSIDLTPVAAPERLSPLRFGRNLTSTARGAAVAAEPATNKGHVAPQRSTGPRDAARTVQPQKPTEDEREESR